MVIEWVLKRVKKSKRINKIVLATTKLKEDSIKTVDDFDTYVFKYTKDENTQKTGAALFAGLSQPLGAAYPVPS